MTPLSSEQPLPLAPAPTRPPRTVLGARGMERVVSALLSKFEARDRLRQQHTLSTVNEREPTEEQSQYQQPTTTPEIELALRSPAHSINVLDLSNQCIGDEGAVALAALLVRDSYITSINLSHNYISERGVLALADAIQRNCGSLQKVSLVDNDISNKAAVALFKAIKALRYRLAETTAKKSLSNSSSSNNGGRVGIQSLEIGFSSPETLVAIMTAQQASLKEKKAGGGGDSTPRQFDHSRLHLSDDACIALSEACFCSADGFGSLTSQQCLPFTLKSLKIVNSPLSFTASSLGALVRGASSAVWAAPDEQPSGGQYHVSWTYGSANRGSSVSPRDGPLCELSLVNCIDFGPLRSNENGIKAFTVPLCQSIISPPLAYQQHALLSGGGLRQLELHHLPLADAGVQDIFYALITNERMRHKIIAAQQKSLAAAAAAVGVNGGITTPVSPTTTRNYNLNGGGITNGSFEVSSPVSTSVSSPNSQQHPSMGLVSISLSKSRFHQPLSLTTIADFIALNPLLRRLDLSHCYAAPRRLISDGAAAGGGATLLHPLWIALATNKNLQHLDVTGFPLTTEDIKTVCDIFVQGLNTTLLTIEYAPNSILLTSPTSSTLSPSESARMLASCLLANASGLSSSSRHRSSSSNPARRGVSYGRQQTEDGASMPTSARDRRRSLSRGGQL